MLHDDDGSTLYCASPEIFLKGVVQSYLSGKSLSYNFKSIYSALKDNELARKLFVPPAAILNGEKFNPNLSCVCTSVVSIGKTEDNACPYSLSYPPSEKLMPLNKNGENLLLVTVLLGSAS